MSRVNNRTNERNFYALPFQSAPSEPLSRRGARSLTAGTAGLHPRPPAPPPPPAVEAGRAAGRRSPFAPRRGGGRSLPDGQRSGCERRLQRPERASGRRRRAAACGRPCSWGCSSPEPVTNSTGRRAGGRGGEEPRGGACPSRGRREAPGGRPVPSSCRQKTRAGDVSVPCLGGWVVRSSDCVPDSVLLGSGSAAKEPYFKAGKARCCFDLRCELRVSM